MPRLAPLLLLLLLLFSMPPVCCCCSSPCPLYAAAAAAAQLSDSVFPSLARLIYCTTCSLRQVFESERGEYDAGRLESIRRDSPAPICSSALNGRVSPPCSDILKMSALLHREPLVPFFRGCRVRRWDGRGGGAEPARAPSSSS